MRLKRNPMLAALLLAVAAVTWPGTAHADTVVPSAQEFSEGNINNTFPFNFGATTQIPSMRYQQVYGSGDFGGAILITAIAFRPEGSSIVAGMVVSGDGAAFGPTTIPVLMRLSTTGAPVNGLSPFFDANFGADLTTVISGNVTISSAFTGPALGPKDFDIIFVFDTPFLYDPSTGNLLLDVVMPIAPVTTTFDAHYDEMDAVSRQYAFTSSAGVSDFADSLGLVTKFISTPVPEPGVAALIAVAGLALSRRVRRASRRS